MSKSANEQEARNAQAIRLTYCACSLVTHFPHKDLNLQHQYTVRDLLLELKKGTLASCAAALNNMPILHHMSLKPP